VLSIEASGLYTVLLYLTRRFWLPLMKPRPVACATALGIFNAALVEGLFLAAQTALGAKGVAANPNLFLDWLLTMPWYAGMVWIFVRVQRVQRYSAAAVLLWGALYETGSDGTLGGVIVPAIVGSPVNLLPHVALLIGLAFWQFMLVYSSMVLPPAWVLAAAAPADLPPARAKLWHGLKPLLWMVPYGAYLVAALMVVGIVGSR